MVPNFQMARFDASKNEVEGEEFTQFPMINFYKRGQKRQPISYTGPREIEEIREFIKENSEDYRRYLEKIPDL